MSKQEEAGTSNTIIEDSYMENVELHRAESMVNDDIDIPEYIIENKTGKNKNSSVPSRSVLQRFAEVRHRTETFCSKIQYMKVEVIMFVYMFSYILRTVTSTQMMIDKVCLVHLGRPEYECNNLTAFKELKSTVEKMANNYHLGHSFIQMFPSAVLSLFIGTWSDKYSRKIPIIASLIGISIDGIGATLCAYFMKSRIEFYYIPALFTGLSGGFIGVLLVLYSYASDTSTSENRTLKYALMEMAFGLSMPLGALAGGYIFKYYGYIPVFLTSTCGHIFGLFWVLLILDETKGLDNKDSWKIKFRNFWTFKSVVDSYKATVKWRPNRGRAQIWALIVGMSISVFSFASTAGIGYFYVYHLYDWNNTKYSTVSAVFSVITIAVMFIVVPLSKRLKIGDAWLGLVGSVSLMLKMLGTGLAYRQGIYFLANLLGIFSSLASLAGRSRLSKVASQEDLGKVFAFMTTAESLLPIFATAVVSQIFNATLDFFPGLLYVIMGALLLIPVGIFVWLALLPAIDYEKMDNSQQENKELEEKKAGKSIELQQEKSS